MKTRIVTPPQQLAVTLSEARKWARVDTDITDQDSVLVLLVGAACEYAENLTGRAFVSRELEAVLDEFPCGGIIELPYPPLISVASVSYIDGDGALQTMEGSPDRFQTSLFREPGHIRPLYGESWPAVRCEPEAVRIRYTAGYPTMSALPRVLKLWIESRMATLYENREQLVTGTIVNELPRAFVDGLLDSLVVASRIA